MTQCAVTQLAVTPGQTIDGSVLAQAGTPPYTVTAATAGILLVSNGDLVISNSAAPGSYTRSVTIQDANGDPVTCTIQFNVSNASAGACLNITVNDGDTITPGMVQQGATAFGSPVVAGVNGVNFTGDTSTSVTVACAGNSNGTIDLRMSNGTICTVNVNCGTVRGGGCLNLTVNDGDTITPGQVKSGATAFGSPVVAGLQGVTFSNDSSTSVTVACTGTANGIIDLRLSDGSICAVNVNCGAVNGGCLNFSVTSQVGSTVHQILPSNVHSTETAFASGAIAGEVDPDNCIIVTNDQTNLVGYRCTGECTGAQLTLEMANGETCPVTINCQNVITNPLQCSITTLNVTAGQTIDGSTFVTGGTQPYTVTGAASGISSVSNGDLVIDAGAAPGTYTRNVTVSDGAGGSVVCAIAFTVSDAGGGDCIDTADSSITVSPATVTPGNFVTITTNLNATTGGFPNHIVQIQVSNGATVGAVQVSGNTWRWTVPDTCIDGTYTVLIVPTDAGCPTWQSETFNVTGCDVSTECDFNLAGACPTATPVNPNAGDVVSVTLAADQCNCDGYYIQWEPGRVVNGVVVANPRTISISGGNTRTPAFTIPADAQNGEQYGIYPTCCPIA